MNHLASLINKLKWGYLFKKPYIDIPSFSLGKKIAKYLSKYGYISGFELKYNKDSNSYYKLSNIFSLNINNIDQLRNLYSQLYSISLINKLSNKNFINFVLSKNKKSKDILQYFEQNKLLNIKLYIVTFTINNKINKLIYWSKKDLQKDLNSFEYKNREYIRLYLKYYENTPSIKDAKTMSLPSQSFYWSVENMAKAPRIKKLQVRNFLKFRTKYIRMRINYVISTTKGLMSAEDAFLNRLGGIVLFKIYS